MSAGTVAIGSYRQSKDIYFTDEQTALNSEWLFDRHGQSIGRIFRMEKIVLGTPYTYWVEWRTIQSSMPEILLYERRMYGDGWDDRNYFMYKK